MGWVSLHLINCYEVTYDWGMTSVLTLLTECVWIQYAELRLHWGHNGQKTITQKNTSTNSIGQHVERKTTSYFN